MHSQTAQITSERDAKDRIRTDVKSISQSLGTMDHTKATVHEWPDQNGGFSIRIEIPYCKHCFIGGSWRLRLVHCHTTNISRHSYWVADLIFGSERFEIGGFDATVTLEISLGCRGGEVMVKDLDE